jgi:hypothetical protein
MIYDRPLTAADFHIDLDRGLTFTIDASGINCTRSLYRYRIRLTSQEARDLARAVLKKVGQSPAGAKSGEQALGCLDRRGGKPVQ